MRLIEFTMCSFRMDCTVLLGRPNQLHRQWFTTTTNISIDTIQSNHEPLIEVEAMFEPAVTEIPEPIAPMENTSQVNPSDFDDPNVEITALAVDTGTSVNNLAPLPPPPYTDELDLATASATTTPKELDIDFTHEEDVSITAQSKTVTVKTSVSLSAAVVQSRQHLLQRTNFRFTPAFCCVCGQSLLSLHNVLWTHSTSSKKANTSSASSSSWKCERCFVDCCDDCRLQVDVQLPCGSEDTKTAVRNAIQNKFTVDKLLNVLAPIHDDHSNDPTKIASNVQPLSQGHYERATTGTMMTVVDRNGTAIVPENSANNDDQVDTGIQGIGVLKLNLIRAYILKDTLPAETDPVTIVSNQQRSNTQHQEQKLRPGDYYVRILWSGNNNSVRTRTIQQCSGQLNLNFENETMRFVVYVLFFGFFAVNKC
jgi:hypothetical protein